MNARISEFHGPSQLAEAGQAVLNDPIVTMAVIRGVADFRQSGIRVGDLLDNVMKDDTETAEIGQGLATRWLEEELDFAALQEVIDQWSHNYLNPGYFPMGQRQDARVRQVGPERQRTGFTGPRTIAIPGIGTVNAGQGTSEKLSAWPTSYNDLPGPLSFALRIDPLKDFPLDFYARRLPKPPVEGEKIPRIARFIISKQARWYMNAFMDRARLAPGDGVLFASHPVPTITGLQTKKQGILLEHDFRVQYSKV